MSIAASTHRRSSAETSIAPSPSHFAMPQISALGCGHATQIVGTPATCADYDKYRYGMRDMVAYAKGADGMALYRRYMQRQVTYLVGSEDNDPNHRVLDKACGAEAEGPKIGRAHV